MYTCIYLDYIKSILKISLYFYRYLFPLFSKFSIVFCIVVSFMILFKVNIRTSEKKIGMDAIANESMIKLSFVVLWRMEMGIHMNMNIDKIDAENDTGERAREREREAERIIGNLHSVSNRYIDMVIWSVQFLLVVRVFWRFYELV